MLPCQAVPGAPARVWLGERLKCVDRPAAKKIGVMALLSHGAHAQLIIAAHRNQTVRQSEGRPIFEAVPPVRWSAGDMNHFHVQDDMARA